MKLEKTIVLGDVHGEYVDRITWDIAKQIVRDVKPERIILNGDFIDFYGVSRFDKDPNRALSLQDEIDYGNQLLSELRSVAKKAQIIWVEGNHEARLQKYLWSKAAELSSLRSLTIEELFRLEERGIEYVRSKGRSAYTTVGKIMIGHFDVALANSCASEKKLVLKYAETVIQGHTHKLGKFYKTFGDEEKTVVGVGSGCLCGLDPEYCSDPDWQQGLVLITKVVDENRYFIQDIPIIGHKTLFNNKIYN
jgi:predicted phosphodiesterase